MLSCYVIILFPSLTLLKIWIVSSVIPLVHNFFHRACSSINWSWNLLSIKVVEESGSQTRRRFLALLWTYLSLSSLELETFFCTLQSFQGIEVGRYYQSKPFRNSTCREAKHGNGLWHFCTIFGAFTAKPVRPDDSLEILTEGQKRFLRNNVPDLGPLQQVFYMLFTEKIFPSFLYILLNAILITLWSVITKKPRKVVFDDLPKKRTFFQSIFSRQSHYCNDIQQ